MTERSCKAQRPGRPSWSDWNLDLVQVRGKASLTANKAKRPPRLVFKIIFSMPAGTPPEKVQGGGAKLRPGGVCTQASLCDGAAHG